MSQVPPQDHDYDKTEEAHKLYYTRHDGVLSTISQDEDIAGFPFSSVTPFCLDRKGRPIILISNLAQHTKNIAERSEVSLMIQADVHRNTDVQAQGRLTYVGHASPVPEDEIDEIKYRYVRYLPAAERYFEAHSFNYYRIDAVKGRFIGGFGKIFWLTPEELLMDNPFDEAAETGIIEHMNDDHQDSMKLYLKHYLNLETGPDNTVKMVGVDAKGFDIRRDGFIHRIWFDTPVENSNDVRMAMVHLSKTARGEE
ncbi:MAG: HugZ family pyridoxamine 5'-phosphate oxidase [Candidatus Kariarchaeaceae archaeon]|jgi:putative heme iron utilization protein